MMTGSTFVDVYCYWLGLIRKAKCGYYHCSHIIVVYFLLAEVVASMSSLLPS